MLATFLACVGIPAAMGARGMRLLFAALVAFYPLGMVISFITRRLIPPKLTFSDEHFSQFRGPSL
jgi:hypothetical protein